MIRLSLSAENKVGVAFSGNNFYLILQIMRSMASANYDKSVMLWNIPIDELDLFLSNNIVKNDVILSTVDLEKNYDDYKNRKEIVDDIKKAKLPSVRFGGFKCNMMPFQTVGTVFLYNIKKCILADEVGLGKTITSISSSLLIDVDYVLIVCPAALVDNWIRELSERVSKDCYINVKEYSVLRRKGIYLNPYKKYLIFSYNMFTKDINDIYETFKLKKCLVIADEIQYIKNYSAQRTKALIRFSKTATYFYGLSATYLETGLENLQSIFQVINENIFGKNIYKFYNEYVNMDYMGNIRGYKNVEKIKNKIYPYVLRRNKEEVLEQLPKRIELIYWVELSKTEQKRYEEIQDGIIKEIKEQERAEKVMQAPNILSMIQYLQQACLHPELVGSQGESSKLKELIDIIKSLNDKKILIFCTYIKMVEIINKKLNDSGYSSIYIHGQTKFKKTDILDKFQTDPNIRFLVCSEVFREGLNITAASTVIHFNLLWNPAKIEQRTGRIDRIGQKSRHINVIYIVVKNTIEIDIFERVKKRQKLYDDVVNNNFQSNRTMFLERDNNNKMLEILRKKY